MARFGVLDGPIVELTGVDEKLLQLPATSIGRTTGWELTSCTADQLEKQLETVGLTLEDAVPTDCAGGTLWALKAELDVDAVSAAFWVGGSTGLRLTGVPTTHRWLSSWLESLRPRIQDDGLAVSVGTWERQPCLCHIVPGVGLLQYRRPRAADAVEFPKWAGTRLESGAEVFRTSVREGMPYLVAQFPSSVTATIVPPPEVVPDMEILGALEVEWSVGV